MLRRGHRAHHKILNMKKLLLSVAALALVLLGGCVVESVYPYYTAKDAIFDAALNGTWTKRPSDPEPGESWTFETMAEKAYWLTINNTSETSRYEAHLFRLKQQAFLDLLITNRNDGMLPLHLILKVDQISPSFKFRLMSLDWLGKLLEKNPKAIKHIIVSEEAGTNDKKKIVLTAETPELQAFVLKYANNEDAFPDPTEFKRR